MLKFIRRILLALVVLAVFGSLASLAYFTNHPDSPVLERAESWPWVGPLAARFRLAYLGSPEGTEEDDSESDTVILVDRDGNEITGPINLTGGDVHPDFERASSSASATPSRPPTLESSSASSTVASSTVASSTVASSTVVSSTAPPSSAPDPPSPEVERVADLAPRPPSRRPSGIQRVGDQDAPAAMEAGASRRMGQRNRRLEADPESWTASSWRWFLPEQPLHETPGSRVAPDAHLSGLSYLPVLEEQGDWVEVIHGANRAWIDRSWRPPHKRKASRRGIVRSRTEPVRGSDRGALRRARKKHGVEKSTRTLGPYQLYTDVEDDSLLDFLDQVARLAEDAFFARFGRLPSGDPHRSIIIFAEESTYRSFAASADLPFLGHGGYAGQGVAITYAGARSREELASVMVHEIGHLLNRRAMTAALPPWLGEGMAEELAALWLEDRPETAASDGQPRTIRFNTRESRLIVAGLALRKGELPRLGTVLGASREAFYAQGNASVSYALAGMFVRYLLDGENRRHADGFRAFLGRIAAGQRADLLAELGVDQATLERGIRRYIVEQLAAIEAEYPGIQFR